MAKCWKENRMQLQLRLWIIHLYTTLWLKKKKTLDFFHSKITLPRNHILNIFQPFQTKAEHKFLTLYTSSFDPIDLQVQPGADPLCEFKGHRGHSVIEPLLQTRSSWGRVGVVGQSVVYNNTSWGQEQNLGHPERSRCAIGALKLYGWQWWCQETWKFDVKETLRFNIITFSFCQIIGNDI